jgi:uncharacterized membrane protein YeiH
LLPTFSPAFGGSAVFALSGSMLAADRSINIIGCCLVGSASAIGGGTVSNILHGQTACFLDKRSALPREFIY